MSLIGEIRMLLYKLVKYWNKVVCSGMFISLSIHIVVYRLSIFIYDHLVGKAGALHVFIVADVVL